MIKIDSQEGSLKPTYCLTRGGSLGVVRAVIVDYTERDLDFDVGADDGKQVYHLDFGGMLLKQMAPVTVDCLSFFPHQVYLVQKCLEDADVRVGFYVKLHGRNSCFCVPTEVRASLLGSIRARYAEFEALADQQVAEWEKSVSVRELLLEAEAEKNQR